MSKKKMHNVETISGKRFNQIMFFIAFGLVPQFAQAGWMDTLKSWASDLQVGLYALGGVLALGSLMWVGIKWQISRSNGDMETTVMDYFKQVALIAIVGATMIIGAAAWQMFGGTGV
jgi:hypothetical protein